MDNYSWKKIFKTMKTYCQFHLERPCELSVFPLHTFRRLSCNIRRPRLSVDTAYMIGVKYIPKKHMLHSHTRFPPCNILGFSFSKFFNPVSNQCQCVTQHPGLLIGVCGNNRNEIKALEENKFQNIFEDVTSPVLL